MSEIQDVAQIVRVSYEGVDICLKTVGTSWKFIQEFFGLFKKMIDHEKLSGKTSVRKLLNSGGDLQVFKFETADLKEVKKLADKHKILYAVLPDINKKDGMSEIVFHSQAAPRVQAIMEMIKNSKIETMDDYFENGEPEELDKIVREAGKKLEFGERDYKLVASEFLNNPGSTVSDIRQKMNLKWLDIWPVVKHMQKNGLLQISDDKRVDMQVSEQDFETLIQSGQWKEWFPGTQNKEDSTQEEKLDAIKRIQKRAEPDMKSNGITIDRKLITEETEHHIKTRIPYRRNEHIWISKENITWINDNKTIYTTLDKEKTYTVLNDNNDSVRRINGEKLYEQSYDAVKKERDQQERERIRKKQQKHQESQKAVKEAKKTVNGKARRR